MASIYVLGDSHTQALGPRLKSRLPEHRVRFEAFRGHSTDRAHGKASIPSGQDVVVLSLGGNDWGDKTAARAALVRAVEARNPGARIVWFGPFTAKRSDVDARHARQTRDQRAQLPGLGVRYYDTRPWSRTGHRSDRVHFTGTGYSRIADAMAGPVRVMAQAGKKLDVPGAGGAPALLATLGAAAVGLWLILRD
jgi:lysophospholipase L1-like esterase